MTKPAAPQPAVVPIYRFTIYSRVWCHLCDDMRVALEEALAVAVILQSSNIEMIDVDTDARVSQELLAQYDERVPVLLASKEGDAARELCHYHLDRDSLATFLAA